MADREKVIKGLECLIQMTSCVGCPYWDSGRTRKDCLSHIGEDAIALLKEQEDNDMISDAIHETAKQFRRTIVRCKDCKHRPELKLYSDRQGNYTAVEFPDGSKCPCQCEDFFYSWYPKDDWFCANGEHA